MLQVEYYENKLALKPKSRNYAAEMRNSWNASKGQRTYEMFVGGDISKGARGIGKHKYKSGLGDVRNSIIESKVRESLQMGNYG